ncbi:hypothetical protein [Mycobacterium spongiae]|uniref:DUF4832 domain-containing protein n=1 Tax=Mycobacterium spongiae TaxID=886343 RepID=A0A975PXW8_9MYCO|nr:hypothetical protein [Mycobacterium spongiae]QUR68696.1 hypothetical protein F6B93_17890 [Mycobacterium spongiae]
MVRNIKSNMLVVVACLALVLVGCSRETDTGPLTAMVSPAIPSTVQEISNPLRGQYEDLMEPLFPQGQPVQQRYPAWPASYDASLRVSWRQLQPADPASLPPDAPDDRKFDFRVIDDALARLADRGMRLMLRIDAYSSCCHASYPDNTNIAIPDWLRAVPGTSTSFPGPAKGPSAGVTQVVPNFNDPTYLNDFAQLLAALGRRYDNDERLSVFEFSGYGDSSENHVAYLRDRLGAPGPAPDESVARLGYYSQFRDQNITAASIHQLIAANVSAFPHTQLVTSPANPEIVRELFADDVTEKLSAPVGVRSDCLGVEAPMPNWAEASDSEYVQTKDVVVGTLRQRLATAPVITEWCRLPSGTSPESYYARGLHDVIKYHVSMTSSRNFPDQRAGSPMDPELYVLWAQANATAGYRYSVEARPGSQSLDGQVAAISVAWTNYGSAAATEKWVPGYRLVDFAGQVIRTLPATVDLRALVPDQPGDRTSDQPLPASATETVRVDLAGLPAGHYTLRASVDWQQHKPNGTHVMNYPPMQLARDGRDTAGFYPIATLDIPRDAQSSVNTQ